MAMLALLAQVLKAAGVVPRYGGLPCVDTTRPALVLLDAPLLLARAGFAVESARALQWLADDTAAWLDAEVGARRTVSAVVGLDTAAVLPLHEAGVTLGRARDQWIEHAHDLAPALDAGELVCPARLATLTLDCVACPSRVASAATKASVATALGGVGTAEDTKHMLAVAQTGTATADFYARRVLVPGRPGVATLPLTASRQERGYKCFPEPATALGKLLRYVTGVGSLYKTLACQPTLFLRTDDRVALNPTVVIVSARPDALLHLLVYAHARARLGAEAGLGATTQCPPDVWLRVPACLAPPGAPVANRFQLGGYYVSLAAAVEALAAARVDVPTLAVLALLAGRKAPLARALWERRADLAVVPDARRPWRGLYAWQSPAAAADAYAQAHDAAVAAAAVAAGALPPRTPMEASAAAAWCGLPPPPDYDWAGQLNRALHVALHAGVAASEYLPSDWVCVKAHQEANTGYRLVHLLERPLPVVPAALRPGWIATEPSSGADIVVGDCLTVWPAPQPWS